MDPKALIDRMRPVLTVHEIFGTHRRDLADLLDLLLAIQDD